VSDEPVAEDISASDGTISSMTTMIPTGQPNNRFMHFFLAPRHVSGGTVAGFDVEASTSSS
jgi:hypothetical protein